MNYLSVENLSKTFGEKPLFETLAFGLQKGEKTALIANNGTGKSTLFKIIAGKETADTGLVTIRDGIKTAFLEQEPFFVPGQTIDELINSSHSAISKVVQNYEKALLAHSREPSSSTQKNLETATDEMDHNKAWDYERRLKQILNLFRIIDTTQKTELLSGGERKRLAIALVLLDEPEMLLLDEPTNHLDVDMIEWLEAYLTRSNLTILMVTHDRYFLDRVCNHILELSNGQLYHHKGNYAYFLQKKTEREEIFQVETDKARQLMKKELEWLRRQPKARTHKSKSRIRAYDDIKEKATGLQHENELKLEVKAKRLGGKILEIDHLCKRYGKIKIVENFNYLFRKGERIGIIGRNGTGKTSFLNLITGNEKADSGKIETGETIIFGYYQQVGITFVDDKKVIDVVNDIAEVIQTGDGKIISASKFLEYFMFPPEVQYKQVSLLSGGEKRRLNLLTVLIRNPNFLILDEPTNDLDLLVINRLEEFLMNYKGCLLLVSHDRYFLDKLTDHLFIFEGGGKVKDFYGSYSNYNSLKEKEKHNDEKQDRNFKADKKQEKRQTKVKTKLSFNEKREYEKLEKEIDQLEKEKSEVENSLNSGLNDFQELNMLSARAGELIRLIDEKTLRWMELDEFV
jgi:ABC transport system ATP-binding/permease protein